MAHNYSPSGPFDTPPPVTEIDPTKNAVIIEIIGNEMICHIECKDIALMPALTELAQMIKRECMF